MTERIRKLTDLTLSGEMFAKPVHVDFDREDLFLEDSERDVKRLCEYILAQEPVITEYSALTGFFQFDGSVVGDAFRRGGHRRTGEVMSAFYLKSVDNLSTMEWQHATADYAVVLREGISGMKKRIAASAAVHEKPEEISFLRGLDKTADAMIGWARKCAERAAEYAGQLEDDASKARLMKLSKTLERVPEDPPETFYEAVLTIYLCFSADPDSLGTLDRYLIDFYRKDIAAGRLTEDEASEYLAELFLMIQAATPRQSSLFTRGGESHFCVGGYLPDGTDGFNELSRLIIETMISLPTFIPQITLRWTKKLSDEDLYYVMDAERRDPHKRIAYTNDEKRLECYTKICGIPFEHAVSYTMVGCNEPAFLGAITGSNSKGNILKPIERLFHEYPEKAIAAADFDDFYAEFEKLLFADMETICSFDDKYNSCRARDINYVSSLFFGGCIENAKSLTQGGCDIVAASPMFIGITNVIDALTVVRQFVFDEKAFTMKELCDSLRDDWEGHERTRALILRTGVFFGNDDERSNDTAARLYDSFYRFLKDRKNLFGYHFLVGDLLGYNEHHKWFGEKTKATPDGRHSGDMLKFGIGQSEGRDRNGLTALLASIAKADRHAIACGSTVTNVSLDETLIKNNENFKKTVEIFKTYFKMGGVHFQLNVVSREKLLEARREPEKHGSLRVRVTGFSDYFTNLEKSVQDDIISRTEEK